MVYTDYQHQDKDNGRASSGLAKEKAPLTGDQNSNSVGKEPVDLNVSAAASDKSQDRDKWGGKLDFIMTSLSLSVGMGNMWRFPYLVYRNGGGAFLIPYMIVAVVLGVPCIFLEYILGQYGRAGIVKVWKVCPLFKGIGWGTFLMSMLGSYYYIVLISWCFYYIIAAFSKELPWGTCDNPWNTDKCVSLADKVAASQCLEEGGIWTNKTCVAISTLENATYAVATNATGYATGFINKTVEVASSDEYFHNEMLKMTDGIHDIGFPMWKNVLCLLLTWAIVFVCLGRGIQSFGKAAYVTALFPYLILTTLLVRGLMLEGSVQGLIFFFKPRWEMLASPKVWVDAAVQVFYSLSIAWGGHITLASYNDFKNHCLRDAIIVVVGDTLTSVYGGMVIFSFLGYMAHVLNAPISEVATQGAGLAFIVYPEAVTTLPCPQLWAILFMLTLISVGIGTQFGLIQTVHATLLEALPEKLRSRPALVLFVLCAILFILDLPMACEGGLYVLQLLDAYCTTYGMFILSLVTAIALPWVYGTKNLIKNVEEMLGIRLNFVFVIWWRFVIPIIITALLGFSLFDYRRTTYGEYKFPLVCEILGWMIVALETLCIPVTAAILIIRSKQAGTIIQKIKHLCRPTPEWRSPAEYRQKDSEEQSKVPLNGNYKPDMNV